MPALSAGRATDCHQRKVKQVGHWIAYDVCFNVPHRQFVFTMPKPLRGIFRKRRKLLDLLFHEAITSLRDWFRTRLGLPHGELAAIAGAKKRIGSYAAVLGGVDTLVFAGGIGENAPSVRARICAGLDFLGIQMDAIRNAESAAVISNADGVVKVRVIHTNEELMIVRSVRRLLKSEVPSK